MFVPVRKAEKGVILRHFFAITQGKVVAGQALLRVPGHRIIA